ncbi:hypothetical protein CRUP_037974 [Coryphaenoides rupestris]|nr:hypothetical protein CRUP_037974 [Coryphaenoides rupestris]
MRHISSTAREKTQEEEEAQRLELRRDYDDFESDEVLEACTAVAERQRRLEELRRTAVVLDADGNVTTVSPRALTSCDVVAAPGPGPATTVVTFPSASSTTAVRRSSSRRRCRSATAVHASSTSSDSNSGASSTRRWASSSSWVFSRAARCCRWSVWAHTRSLSRSVVSDGHRHWEAIKKWDEALELTPENPLLYEMKSQVLTILQEVFPAVKAAEMVVKLKPMWWEGWQTLGRAQLSLGEVDLVRTRG